jgi:hypothetical protein
MRGVHMTQKPTNWHLYTPTTSFRELCLFELLHEPEGSFPISIFSDALGGGETPLELMRTETDLVAVYYFSMTAAKNWESKFREIFEDKGWKEIDGKGNGLEIPKVVGKVVPRELPQLLVDAIEDSIELLNPHTIRTGNQADESYSCPNDSLRAI